MYEVDFLPIESETGKGSKSGDAIAIRFDHYYGDRQVVVVIDGGFKDTGDALADHIIKYYDTNHVDLMISTHPDADHLNGLETVLDRLVVDELMVHQPRLHASSVTGFSNLDALDDLLKLARSKGTTLTEPFTGLVRFDGQLRILGPTQAYYEELLAESLAPVSLAASMLRQLRASEVAKRATDLLNRVAGYLPIETLANDGDTGPRNESSVVTLIQCDDDRMVFTGDAGIESLSRAADEYEAQIGAFSQAPIDFFQAPHHGSKRNLGPDLLDRLLGSKGAPHQNMVSFISSAKIDPDHPSPKVVNALMRRGANVNATEGRAILHRHEAPDRDGWVALTPLLPLVEEDDD